MTESNPQYINDRQSDLRGVKEGWYVIDARGELLSGPFCNQEDCRTRMSRSAHWTASFEVRRLTH